MKQTKEEKCKMTPEMIAHWFMSRLHETTEHVSSSSSELELELTEKIKLSECKLREQLGLAQAALEELQLGHEHNESNDDYRPLSDTRGWCSICSEKVGLNEDTAREALRSIEECGK